MKRKVTRKNTPAGAKRARAKPVRSKSVRKRAAAVAQPRRSAAAAKQDFLDALVSASMPALGLTMDPKWRKGVSFNLGLVFYHAARVEAFSLPDDTEPAPVFHA